MNILIKSSLRTKRPATKSIKRRLALLLKTLGLPDAELSILLVGDASMRSFNRRYRNIDKTTDVLSFSLREGQFRHLRPEMLGDIVLSVPAARRQAKKADHTLHHEIERLLVHGLLHLLGYDHERSRRDAHRMAKQEDFLLKILS